MDLMRVMAKVEEDLERFRGRDELGYAVKMWDYALRAARREGSQGLVSDARNILPYVPDAVMRQLPADSTPLRVLDVGCLGGHGLFDVHRRHGDRTTVLAGVDIAPHSIDLAQSLAPAWSDDVATQFVCAGADQLPFADRDFHLIIARLVLPYVNVSAVLDEFARVSSVRCVWLIQTHSFRYYWTQLLAQRRSVSKMIYYLRPILSGSVFSMTGWQCRQNRWREIALSSRQLIKQCRHRGLACVWRNEHASMGQPMLAFRKSDSGTDLTGDPEGTRLRKPGLGIGPESR